MIATRFKTVPVHELALVDLVEEIAVRRGEIAGIIGVNTRFWPVRDLFLKITEFILAGEHRLVKTRSSVN